MGELATLRIPEEVALVTEIDMPVEFEPVQAAMPETAVSEEPYGSKSMFDKIRESRVGRFVALGGATLAMAGAAETMSADRAEAQAPAPATVVKESLKIEMSVAGSKVSAEDVASGKKTILGNILVNGTPKAKVRKAEKNGDCKTVDGKKTAIYTEGRKEAGRAWGRDTRVSRFCKIAGRWVRVKCGNPAKFKKPAKAIENVIWVKNYSKTKLSLKAHAEADARAECKTSTSSAIASGHGEADAKVTASLKSTMKIKGRMRQLIVRMSGSASGSAKAKATATAEAFCATVTAEQTPVTPPPTPEQPTKDGTEGAGSTTPGQPGGEGAGGEPAPVGDDGTRCRDTADTQYGDQNASTEGDIMNGPSDQYGYCTAPAKPIQ